MRLRDEMAQVIYESTTLNQHGETHALADEILALVREELTSEEAVTAACEAWQASDAPYFEGNMQDAIAAALDAVNGEEVVLADGRTQNRAFRRGIEVCRRLLEGGSE